MFDGLELHRSRLFSRVKKMIKKNKLKITIKSNQVTALFLMFIERATVRSLAFKD